MAQLRRKLEVDPAQPAWIVTEPRIGYRLREPT
jgi:DNA-binding response OmpR family regulator